MASIHHACRKRRVTENPNAFSRKTRFFQKNIDAQAGKYNSQVL